MKPIVKGLLVIMFAAGATCQTLFAQVKDSYFLHTVEKGQSLYSLSSMYHVPVDSIILLNPSAKEMIIEGQQLRIPRAASPTVSNETYHTIQSGETLYRLSTKYGVTIADICSANPGLGTENFKVGEVIRIPVKTKEATAEATPKQPTNIQTSLPLSPCRDMHKVARKETIFSISRMYGISEEELIAANPELKEGLKRGKFVCIPYDKKQPGEQSSVITPDTSGPTNAEAFKDNKKKTTKYKSVKAALLLPIANDKRMLEYYEGFLMAVDSLKRTGTSIDLQVYNLDDSANTLDNLLMKPSMKNVNVIFGPAQSAHTNRLAAFAKKNDINLVIPFSSKEDEVFNNAKVYQINTPQSYLYSEVYEHFLREFPKANVIFLDAGAADKSKRTFIEGLKQQLREHNINFRALPETASVEGLKEALIADKENVFIPTSGSDVTLIKSLPNLKILVRENPDAHIHLFGYPEWQTYTKDHLENFFELDTYFYSSFYTNNLLPAAIDFTRNYHKWYQKEMEHSFPKYGMLGFDTAFFFLKGLSLYGSALENNLAKMDIRPIQTGFLFDRVNNWGGFINKKVFFVRFSKDYELIKLDFE